MMVLARGSEREERAGDVLFDVDDAAAVDGPACAEVDGCCCCLEGVEGIMVAELREGIQEDADEPMRQ